MAALGNDLADALADARRGGVGWVQIRKITTEQTRLSRVDPALVVVLDDQRLVLRELVLAVPCGYCGVGVGESCRTKSGARSTYAHGDRSEPVYAAWRAGMREGMVDALRRLTKDWRTPTVELLAEHGLRW